MIGHIGRDSTRPDEDGAVGWWYQVIYQVSDLSGNPAQEKVRSVEVSPPGNAAPVSDAGLDQAVSAGALVQLDGTASYDPDGDSLNYAWRQIGGTAVTLSSGFADVSADDLFAADIEWLADAGITKGCNPPVNDEFCPDGLVTRGQMAAFLHRALGG